MSNGEVLVLGSRGEDFDETLQFCFVVERHTEEFWRGREGGREEKGERGRRGGGEREERGRREGERQEEERKKNRESGMKEG